MLLAIICVTLSPALFALGSTNPTGSFYLRTLSFSRPMTIMGPILDMVSISHSVDGMI
jgi:hypothetical protein